MKTWTMLEADKWRALIGWCVAAVCVAAIVCFWIAYRDTRQQFVFLQDGVLIDVVNDRVYREDKGYGDRIVRDIAD